MPDYIELIKQKTRIREPQELFRFETWFNKNLGVVLDGNKPPYKVWLLIYSDDLPHGWYGLQVAELPIYDSTRNSLSGTRSFCSSFNGGFFGFGANEITNHPIYHVLSYGNRNEYVHLNEIKKWPFFITDHLDNKNPDNYLKPLDTVWVEKSKAGKNFFHVGVFLGDNQVCHYSGEDKKQYKARIKITSWSNFVEGRIEDGEISWGRAVVPFKHYKYIAQQIDWANNNSYWEGKYCLANNNCEHRANSFVYGINYSRQVLDKTESSLDACQFWRAGCEGGCQKNIANNGKGSTIKLVDEIRETNMQLKKSSGYWYHKIVSEYETKTVVPSKGCRIM